MVLNISTAAAVKASRSRSRSRSSPSPPAVRKMGNVMRRASQVLSERGERLMRADDKTSHLLHGAKQFSEAAQKVSYSDLLEIKLHIVMNSQAVK